MFKNKKILITGGTGSFGRKFISEMLKKYSPKKLMVYSRDELKQYQMKDEFKNNKKFKLLRFFLGDIRDYERLFFAFQDVDYIIHAAALKQVPAAEYNPFEAVKTNVIGTQNIIEVAMETGVEKVILVSTDKVVNPINTMGTTKLLAEKLMRSANFYKGPRETVFSCVRFGNVLGSSGSVVPLFKEQLNATRQERK